MRLLQCSDHDEVVQFLDVLQFGATVEQERRVVLCRQLGLVQCLQVCRQVVDPGRVQELKT